MCARKTSMHAKYVQSVCCAVRLVNCSDRFSSIWCVNESFNLFFVFLTTRKDLPTVVRLTGTHSPQPLVKQQSYTRSLHYHIREVLFSSPRKLPTRTSTQCSRRAMGLFNW